MRPPTDRRSAGEPIMCGWLKDRYGMRWQIVPRSFVEMMMDRDTEKTKRAMAARMQLVKLDVVKLKEAYAEPIGSGLAAKR
ncbi:MAG: VOC family protein [Gammaproteobacteria bacterium]